ncbi:MAG: hypothetical protein ACRYF0_18200 [Janthinobacterium lividum]
MRTYSIARRLLCTCLLVVSLSSCVGFGDIFTQETEIYGPYYVADDPAASYKTLFRRYEEGLDLYRFENVSQVGYSAGHIFIKSKNRFYYFAVASDPGTDLGDPATKQMFSKPLTQTEFNRVLNTLGIKELDFQFQE